MKWINTRETAERREEMLYIIVSMIAGAVSGFITARIMASILIKKLDAIETEHRERLFEISSQVINKL